VRRLNEPLLAVAALVAGAPVGLAVAESRPGHPADVVSLRVDPRHRRRGVGGELLRRLEVAAERAGAEHVQGSFRSGWASRPAIERLLVRGGWSAPQPSLHLFRIGRESAPAEALPEPPPLPEGCEIFPWSALSGEERERILARQAEVPWYPDVLSPFQEAPRLEPRVSLGLRRGGEVAGWLIGHRVSHDTLQYSTLFVTPELQRLGVGLALMAEARRRRTATDYEFAIFAVDPRNRRMLELVERRLAPLVVSSNQMLVSGKRLG
jgi:GNAT superfamily N-acetyltransferase